MISILDSLTFQRWITDQLKDQPTDTYAVGIL